MKLEIPPYQLRRQIRLDRIRSQTKLPPNTFLSTVFVLMRCDRGGIILKRWHVAPYYLSFGTLVPPQVRHCPPQPKGTRDGLEQGNKRLPALTPRLRPLADCLNGPVHILKTHNAIYQIDLNHNRNSVMFTPHMSLLSISDADQNASKRKKLAWDTKRKLCTWFGSGGQRDSTMVSSAGWLSRSDLLVN